MSIRGKRVCVIGAGASGLTSIKSCIEEGLEVVCYEKTSNIGGLWYYRSELIEGVGRIQKSTITNSSKELNSFSDFPIPKEFPNYMSHKKMCEYFELYAKHFNLFPHIRFEHSVIRVEKSDDYESTHSLKVLDQNKRQNNSVSTEIFDGVMVCTGHHCTPRWPQFLGQDLFRGKIIHSRDMTSHLDLTEYENKTAVVVGIGNSGCDCAVELSLICDKTYMALRRGGWVWHRLGPNGIPLDYQINTRFLNKIATLLPYSWICWLYETFLYNQRFNHRLYGIEPNFRCFSQQPIICDVLPTRILSGQVVAKKNIDRFVENGVVFVGEESVTKCDLVVMATGYHYSFPFIDKSLFEGSDDKELNLYKQVFPEQLSHWSLALIGAVQPNGSLFPLMELQARWYALLMTGKCQFPSHHQIVADIAQDNKMREKKFYESPRNCLGVDRTAYMDDIANLIGVKPDFYKYLFSDTLLFMRLCFGSVLSYHYRLNGPHPWSGARDAIMQSDYRVGYPLNPNVAKTTNFFSLNANFYRIIFLLIFFVYIVFEIFDRVL